MSASSISEAPVAVAVVTNEHEQVLLVWNDHWRGFSFPMTKIRPGSPWRETPTTSAIRAGAEALGVPVQASTRFAPAELRNWYLSGRSGKANPYRFDLIPIEPHPHFANRLHIRQPHFFASPYALMEAGIYQPLASVVAPLAERIVSSFGIPERLAPTTTLVITRTGATGREFLLRWNPNWGAYSFPGASRDLAAARPGIELARELAKADLGPAAASACSFAIVPKEIEFSGMPSGSRKQPIRGVPTQYRHLIARAEWSAGFSLNSEHPLHWATSAEVHQGHTGGVPQVPGSAQGEAGPISRTVFRIAQALDLLDDGGDDEAILGLIKDWFG